uniref:Ig-like domain-containing protein n=1 Tax=Panagrolaimus superbus TaxID=310955 RepID=A0A914Y3S0_9BILA
MEGKALHLNCTVDITEKQLMPASIIWTKDSQQLDLNNKFKYHTDSQVNDHNIVYTLQINEVSNIDDGLYACEGDSVPRAAQMVHFNSNNIALPPFISYIVLLIISFFYLSM